MNQLWSKRFAAIQPDKSVRSSVLHCQRLYCANSLFCSLPYRTMWRRRQKYIWYFLHVPHTESFFENSIKSNSEIAAQDLVGHVHCLTFLQDLKVRSSHASFLSSPKAKSCAGAFLAILPIKEFNSVFGVRDGFWEGSTRALFSAEKVSWHKKAMQKRKETHQ